MSPAARCVVCQDAGAVRRRGRVHHGDGYARFLRGCGSVWALARLSMGLDAFQVQTRRLRRTRWWGVCSPASGNVSKFYYAMFQQCFNEERDSLPNKYPPVFISVR